MALIEGLVGAAVAVVIFWLGGQQQRKAQEEQREHEQRTRFHAVRLETYARFSYEAVEALTRLARGRSMGTELSKTYSLVLFVATSDVKETAVELFAALTNLKGQKITAPEEEPILEIFRTFNQRARIELGIDTSSEDLEVLAVAVEASEGKPASPSAGSP